MTSLNWREGFHFLKLKWTQFKIFQWNLLMVWSSVLLDTCILQPSYSKSEAVFTSIFVCNTFLHVSSRQSLTINTCIGCVVHGQTLIDHFTACSAGNTSLLAKSKLALLLLIGDSRYMWTTSLSANQFCLYEFWIDHKHLACKDACN